MYKLERDENLYDCGKNEPELRCNVSDELKSMLIDYVNKNSDIQGLQWDQNSRLKLPFNPYAKSYEERKKIAHYFLLIALITESKIVGKAENSRALMINILEFLGDNCFKEEQPDSFKQIIQNCGFTDQLGPSWDQIPEILASVNSFVENVARGDLIEYAQKFQKPSEMVKEIEKIDGQRSEKAWMYMRWMVRPYPDLEIFGNFSCRDLCIPMTSYIKDVACCLGLCQQDTGFWDNPEKISDAREKVTHFARELFPNDPAKVDYPFYVLGRWITGKDFSSQLLFDYLNFWQKIWKEIQIPPITFDIVSRKTSLFEKEIKTQLEKFNFLFFYEPYSFSLPKGEGAPKYTPDFVLPKCRKNDRTIILEPHGMWTGLLKRFYNLGGRKYSIWVRQEKKDPEEISFISKLEKFKKTSWRDRYHLILIVPSEFKDYVEKNYPKIADEIWDVAKVPRLLYDISLVLS